MKWYTLTLIVADFVMICFVFRDLLIIRAEDRKYASRLLAEKLSQEPYDND